MRPFIFRDIFWASRKAQPVLTTLNRPRRSPRPRSVSKDGDDPQGFVDIELQSHIGNHDELVEQPSARRGKQEYISALGWWTEEYFYAAMCCITAVGCGIFLKEYDNRLVPDTLFWGLQMDTVVIALVTVVRVSMKAFVEAAVSQSAWLWVSQESQRRCKHVARLKDFKLFDEASRGLWGSIVLIWNLRFRHLGSLGAAVIVLVHGFETFSQQMVTMDQRPYPMKNNDGGITTAPVPPRADTWDYYTAQGFASDYVPALSTRAAIYSGLIASNILDITAACETANCSWPVMPTLACEGECGTVPVFTDCDAATCNYSTPSGTSISIPTEVGPDAVFRVAPSSGTVHRMNDTSRAYFAVFDMLNLFCVNAYKIDVANGKQNQTLVGNWSATKVDFASGFQADYIFTDIPAEYLAGSDMPYAVTGNAMTALRSFMTTLAFGTVTNTYNTVQYSSDWTEAMWTALPNLTVWMGHLTTSLTNEIRQQGQVKQVGAASQYLGQAIQLAPFVDVHWYWVIYPGVLIVISVYFLFYTIFVGAHDGVSVWKGDALPMLFCRVDSVIHDRVKDGMDVPDGLDERVGDARVALFRGEDGKWDFKTTD